METRFNISTIGYTHRVINRIDTTFEVESLEEDVLVGCELDTETEFFDEFFVKLGRIWLVKIRFVTVGKGGWRFFSLYLFFFDGMIEYESWSIAIELKTVGSEYVKMIDVFGTFSLDSMDELIKQWSGLPGKYNPFSIFYLCNHTSDCFPITENMRNLVGKSIRENPRYSSDFSRRNLFH